MNDFEEHPLLYVSDEESLAHDHKGHKSRAGYKVTGAAAILTSWPDHCTSSIKYWLFLVVMLFIIVLLVYNCVAVLTLPSTQRREALTSNNDVTVKVLDLPEVFMHKIIQTNEEIRLNYYLPNIKLLIDEYPEFKYNFIILNNDTAEHDEDEIHNEMAMNFLLNDENIFHKREVVEDLNNFGGKLKIFKTTLSSYLDDSPLRKYRRYIPHQFEEFLARSVSIWEKGGIAFNPDILTSKSPHTLYKTKIKNILENVRSSTSDYRDTVIDKRIPKKNVHHKNKPMNNIRDIIDAMDNDIDSNSSESLDAAENKFISTNVNSYNRIRKREVGPESLLSKPNDTNTATQRSIVMSFLKLILSDHRDFNRNDAEQTYTDNHSKHNIKNQRRSIIRKHNVENIVSVLDNHEISDQRDNLLPIIIAMKTKNNMQNINIEQVNRSEAFKELTIDIKGNIIATAAACHAFVGALFTDVIYHKDDETLINFLISELTTFCKGNLGSCYIDLILL